MILKSLKGKNFRNFDSFKIDLVDKGNVFFGNNGAGKTNLLEAVYLLSIFKSFRTVNNKNVIQIGKPGFELEGNLIENDTNMNIELSYYPSKKEILLNNKKVYILSDVVGVFPAVLISPEQYIVTSGPPEARRRFIDLFISQIDKDYLQSLIKYKKILKQRNKALSENGKKEEVKVLAASWDYELAQYCSIVLKKRIEYIEKIKNEIKDLYKYLSGKNDKLDINYQPTINTDFNKEQIFNRIKKNIKRDIDSRTTTIGPHRDDIRINLNSKNIRQFGSQGEHKTAILAIKIAEYNLLKKIKNTSPTLLMDDIDSMLDKFRLSSFLNMFENFEQYFITAVEKNQYRSESINLIYDLNDKEKSLVK